MYNTTCRNIHEIHKQLKDRGKGKSKGCYNQQQGEIITVLKYRKGKSNSRRSETEGLGNVVCPNRFSPLDGNDLDIGWLRDGISKRTRGLVSNSNNVSNSVVNRQDRSLQRENKVSHQKRTRIFNSLLRQSLLFQRWNY